MTGPKIGPRPPPSTTPNTAITKQPQQQPTYVEQSKTEAKQFWGAVGQQTNKAINATGQAISDGYNTAAQGVKDFGNKVSDTAASMKQTASNAWNRFGSMTSSLFGKAKEEVKRDVAAVNQNVIQPTLQAGEHVGKVVIGSAVMAGEKIVELDRQIDAAVDKHVVQPAKKMAADAGHAVKQEIKRDVRAAKDFGNAAGKKIVELDRQIDQAVDKHVVQPALAAGHAMKEEIKRDAKAVGDFAVTSGKVVVGSAVIAGEKIVELDRRIDAAVDKHVVQPALAAGHAVKEEIKRDARAVGDFAVTSGKVVVGTAVIAGEKLVELDRSIDAAVDKHVVQPAKQMALTAGHAIKEEVKREVHVAHENLVAVKDEIKRDANAVGDFAVTSGKVLVGTAVIANEKLAELDRSIDAAVDKHIVQPTINAAVSTGQAIKHGAIATGQEIKREAHAVNENVIKPTVAAADYTSKVLVGSAVLAGEKLVELDRNIDAAVDKHIVQPTINAAVSTGKAIKQEVKREAAVVAEKYDRTRQMMDEAIQPYVEGAKYGAQVAVGTAVIAYDATVQATVNGVNNSYNYLADKTVKAGAAIEGAVNTGIDYAQRQGAAAAQVVDAQYTIIKNNAIELGNDAAATAAEMRKAVGEFEQHAYQRGDEVVRDFHTNHKPGLNNSIRELERHADELKAYRSKM